MTNKPLHDHDDHGLDDCEHPPEYLHTEPRVGKRPFVVCDLCHRTVSGKADDPLIANSRRNRT